MNGLKGMTQQWWWLVQKDLLREWRAPQTWPVMLLLGVVVALSLELHVDVPREQRPALMGGLFWVAVFFGGTAAMDRSFAGESGRGSGAYRVYPIAPAIVYLAKAAGNFAALGCLTAALVLAFIVFSEVPLLSRPGSFLATAVVANLAFAAAGTVLSALANCLPQRGSLLVLLLLPFAAPVLLGAAQATRALMLGDAETWWRWWQLLSCCAVSYVAVGSLLFEFIHED